MYFEPKFETMEQEELRQLQLEKLQSVLTRVSRNVPYYRKKFSEAGVEPDDFRDLSDLRKLPFTTKDVLLEAYPYNLFAVPLREVVRLHASSGSAGKPIVVGYTKNDIKKWSQLVARVMVAGGVGRDDVVQIAFDYGIFTGGFGFHYGAETLGAAVIPVSSGNSRRQAMVMQDYKTTVLVCTPSYALRLAEVMEELGVNVNALNLRFGLFGGERFSEKMREEIERRLHLTATNNYGLSEVMGPGVAGECLEKNGMHVNEDHFLAEIVDPVTGEPVPHGEVGELVLTTLSKEAFPVVRFKTGDLTRFLPGDCPCGRTFARIDRISGRTDDMLVIRGVNVFPARVGTILSELLGQSTKHRITVERKGALDDASIELEASENLFFDQMSEQQRFMQRIKRRLASELGVSFELKLVEAKSLEQKDACQICDLREV